MKRSLGSVKPLEDGPLNECRHWEIRVSIGHDPNSGKRIRPYERFEGTETEANLRLMQIRVAHGIISEDVTVSEFFLGIYLPYAKNRVRRETYDSYEASVRNYIVPMFGRFGLRDLPPYFVEAQLETIELVGARKNAYKTLRQGYRRAVAMRMAEHVITASIEEPDLPPKEKPTVTSADMWKYIDAFEGDDMYLAVVVAFADGPRRSEIAAFDWDEFDWSIDTEDSFGAIRIHRSYHWKKGKGWFEKTKTPKSERLLYFPRWAGEILYANRGEGPMLKHDGERMRPSYITDRWREVVAEKGLPIVMPFKNTRHSCGTMLVREDKMALTDVQQLLGHSTYKTTETFYVQNSTKSIERTAKAMNNRARKLSEIAPNTGKDTENDGKIRKAKTAKIIAWPGDTKKSQIN